MLLTACQSRQPTRSLNSRRSGRCKCLSLHGCLAFEIMKLLLLCLQSLCMGSAHACLHSHIAVVSAHSDCGLILWED